MPRVPPFDRPATYDDLAKLPDIVVAEIADGELHASPRPAFPHAEAGTVLGDWIVPPFHLGNWTMLATHAGEEVVRAEPFEAIALELAALWGEVGNPQVSPGV